MRGLIRTIADDIEPSEVNYALVHEHAFIARNKEKAGDITRLEPAVERRLVSEFRALGKQGVNVFVEVSPIGYARRPDVWLRAARRAGMHVIGTTGYYIERRIPTTVKRMPVRRIARRFHDELTEGMNRSRCKAGIIKVASHDYEPSPGEKKVFLAAAEAHKQTGAPITTHSVRGALADFTTLKKAGVKPDRMALGHIEVNAWLDIVKVARAGAMMLFTNFGGREIVPEDMVIAQIADLVRRGHLRQIMLSVDMYLWVKGGRLVYRWLGGFKQLVGRVIPRLARAGLRPSQIETIMHENPSRHLTWQ